MDLFELLDELVAVDVISGEAALRHKAQSGSQILIRIIS